MIAAVFSPIKGLSTALESTTATTRQLADCSPLLPLPLPRPFYAAITVARHGPLRSPISPWRPRTPADIYCPLSLSLSLEPTTPRPVLADRWVKVSPRIRQIRRWRNDELVSWKLLGGAPREGDRWTIVWRRRNEIPRPLSPYRLEKDVEETFAYIERQFSARTNPRAAFRLRLYRGREVLVPPPPRPVFLYSNVSHHRFTIRILRIGGFFSLWNEI